MNLWRYVITADNGSAPNFESPATTLAICKPRIRRHAQVGDLVVAFAGGPLGRHPHAAVWGGEVTRKLLFRDYWNSEDFQCKKPNKSAWPDNIYQPTCSASLKQIHNHVHRHTEKKSDISGKYVLIFDSAWRIGSDEEPFPGEGYRLEMNARRGHRQSPLTTDERDRWLDWLKSHASPFDSKEVGGHDTCREKTRRRRTSCPPCA